ncbi:MAG: high-affinity iron transporter [Paraglaciecola sp.]|jgi:high-affinity iron transporter
MLINTVILFLRDVLPLFVLLSLLLAIMPIGKPWLSFATLLSLLTCLFFTNQIDFISEKFDGAGMELFFFFCHLLVYLLVWFVGYLQINNCAQSSAKWKIVMSALLIITFIINGTNFLVYFNGFWSQVDAPQSILLGTLLGLGICLSVAVLLHFSLLWLAKKYGRGSVILALLLYASGQLTDSLNLLVQIDWLEYSQPIWDLNEIISDQSELGHFLNVLIGYKASPSIHQLSLYLLAFTLPLLAYWRLRVTDDLPLGGQK